MSDSTTKSDDLSDRQQRALPFLAGSPNIRDGCRKAKITTETYYRWLRQDSFSTALKAQRDSLVSDAMAKLKVNIGKAVDVLVKLLKSENDFLKRQVANDIIGHVLKYRELQEIEDRLETVERIVLERRTYRS